MPELPELTVVSEVLNRRILGQTITSAKGVAPGTAIVIRDLTGEGFSAAAPIPQADDAAAGGDRPALRRDAGVLAGGHREGRGGDDSLGIAGGLRPVAPEFLVFLERPLYLTRFRLRDDLDEHRHDDTGPE